MFSKILQKIRIVKNKIRNKIRIEIRKIQGYKVIYNVNQVKEVKYKKRAILIYLVDAFLLKDNDLMFLYHQNLRQCKQIASILGEFGYIVDVADINDANFKPARIYDLVLSHRFNLNNIKKSLQNSIKIYLSTGINHIISNRNVKKRYENLIERRKCNLKIKSLLSEDMPFVLEADFIIGFGNDFIMKTWQEIVKVPTYLFNNYGFQKTKFIDKKFIDARRNFLFFASSGQVLKGLDLLLDIFPKYPELNLYICSRFEKEKDFCQIYYNELFKTKNIHPVGFILVNSDEFYRLINKCAYIIYPSCSEGQPGAVIQCMYTGLIPILTKESGIDTEDFGITFSNDTIEEIENTIIKLSQMPEEWCKERSIKTRKIAEKKYSEEAFMERWREILKVLHRNINK
ncbi:MAG: glycosyltransferase [Candidatus Eremiobacterota bacterium]